MISRFQKIDELLKQLDKVVEGPVNIYIIGGAALLYQKLKPSTKDIDIIVNTRAEFDDMETALKKMGFEGKKPTREYKKLDIDQIWLRDDFRIDIFTKTVMRGVSLSKGMVLRSSLYVKLKRIKVYFCSLEDILIFKTLTEREGDIDDCVAIATRDIDWAVILKEILEQISLSKKDIWITIFNERLDLLNERGVNVPILGKTSELTKRYYEEHYDARNDSGFQNLEDVRQLMAEELDYDIVQNKVYLSKFMPESYRLRYLESLRKEVFTGSENSLSEHIKDFLLLTKSVGGRTRPRDAHVTFGEGEFNRYYMRAVCRLAISLGKTVKVYRFKQVKSPRQGSEAKIGLILEPRKLLDDLRNNVGADTVLGLPARPNSGLSVKIE
ncbi:MAG: DUF6036 family nucleotidyltransferase [Candidatus Woesearchaeota archaeon]